jgi:hypothetical protein
MFINEGLKFLDLEVKYALIKFFNFKVKKVFSALYVYKVIVTLELVCFNSALLINIFFKDNLLNLVAILLLFKTFLLK